MPGTSISTSPGRERPATPPPAVTNSPAVINMYDDINFVLHYACEFPDRFAVEAELHQPKRSRRAFCW